MNQIPQFEILAWNMLCMESSKTPMKGELIVKHYQEMSREELQAQREELERAYSRLKAKGLKLNMARGRPAGAVSAHAGYPELQKRLPRRQRPGLPQLRRAAGHSGGPAAHCNIVKW